MPADPSSLVAARFRAVAGYMGWFVVLISLVALVGWAFDIEILKRFHPFFPSLKVNAAIGLGAAGIALALRSPVATSDRRRLLAHVLSVLTLLVAVATLTQIILDVNLGIDELLARDRSTVNAPPGRMTGATATALALISLGLLLLDIEIGARLRPTQAAAGISAALGLSAVTGYLLGVRDSHVLVPFASVSLPTALSVTALSLGLLFARPDAGIMRPIASATGAGAIARRMIPALIGLILCAGWLGIQIQRAGWYETEFGLALFAMFRIAAVIGIIWWNTTWLIEAEDRQRSALEALAESREDLLTTVESIGEAVLATDAAGRLTRMNVVAETLTGWSRADALGRRADEVFRIENESTGETMESPIARVLREGVPSNESGQVALRRRDGTRVPINTSVAPIRRADSKVLGVVLVIRDAREAQRSELERLRLVELDSENRRVHAASRMKSEFLANMSHELRTPLNSMIGFAEILHDGRLGPIPPQHKECLGDIMSSGRHLLDLINDVLDIAKVESGKMDFFPERVDLGVLVREVTDALRHFAETSQIDVQTEVSAALGDIVLDPGRFRQVLYNYLSNALKFTPARGRVCVRIRPEGADRFRLEVEDTGIGIAPEDQERLFVEFQQLDSGASKKYQGTGLGLALTRRIVEAQGGQVAVQSVPGAGSTFSATLPRRPEPQAQTKRPADTRGKIPPRVLVLDDDPASQEALRQMLEARAIEVRCHTDITSALLLAAEEPPAAIVLDLLNADKHGFAFLRRLRQTTTGQFTPVVVWTGRDLSSAERAWLATTTQGVVPKGDGSATTVLHALRSHIPSHESG